MSIWSLLLRIDEKSAAAASSPWTRSVSGTGSASRSFPSISVGLVIALLREGRTLVALERVEDRAVIVAEAPLGARLSSNLAAASRRDGTTALAAGTEDGRLLIWP